MSKKILALETSVTMQKLFTTKLDSDDYAVQFINDGKAAIYTLFEFQPDIFLINSDIREPRSFEIVRIVRSIPCFKEMTIGVYSSFPSPLDEAFAMESGATSFVRIDPKTLLLNIDELGRLPSKRPDRDVLSQLKKGFDDSYLFMNAMKVLDNDSYQKALLARLVKMTDSIAEMETLVRDFLSLIAEVCEVPIAGLYIEENDGPYGYYVCSENIGEKEASDFLNVCGADFEKVLPQFNVSKIAPKKLDEKPELNRFFSPDVPLSSYASAELKSSNGMQLFGTVHIVSDGNISGDKQSFFDLSVKNAGIIFDKALIVKKEIFFTKHIRRAFSRFVPPQIIDDLVAAADEEEDKVAVGEKRKVAILFSDIRSFTSISECNRPEVMVAFLNRYFTAMVNAIKRYGGTIDKFIGDAIMAEFGAPVSYEDNARRAVAAAYEMREQLPSVPLEDLVLPEGMKFNIGIGIHYGDVTVGSIGSSDKTDYTVIGDSVNLASRLEGLTKTYGTMIIVSESVKTDIPAGEFTFRYLDAVKVKGKTQPVPIYAVDRGEDDFTATYRDCYAKALGLYRQGVFNLAREYFDKALAQAPGDKAASLMRERCDEFIKNPPESWDGAITFHTK